MTTVLSAGNLTLVDLERMRAPDGKIATTVIPAMARKGSVLDDAVWQEGNRDTGHEIVVETGLPSIAFRRINSGVAPTKMITDKVIESCGMMSSRSQMDVKLANLGGNAAMVRAKQDMAHVRAMGIQFEESFFYASTATDPEQIMGLSPRLNLTTSNYGGQIIDWAGSSSGNDQASMWLVGWGDDKVSCITPRGMGSGLKQIDRGVVQVQDANNLLYSAYLTEFEWDWGIAVSDARYLVRIANIDTSAIVATGHLLIDSMVDAYYKIFDISACKPVFYCNRTIAKYLQLQAVDSVRGGTLTYENVGGSPVTQFMGIPIHISDALDITEAVVS